jgi:hypothetical protein
VFILIVSCSVFLNWVCWTRGNFSGEPGHVYIRVYESPLCGVPGRYEYIGHSANAGGGTVRVFCLLGSVLVCVCVIEQVGWWRDSTIFLVFSALFWRVGTNEMVGGVLHLNFHFLQFVVNCLGGWICAVGISFYLLWYFVVVSRGFLYTSC